MRQLFSSHSKRACLAAVGGTIDRHVPCLLHQEGLSSSSSLSTPMASSCRSIQARGFVSGADAVRQRQLKKSLFPSAGFHGRNKQSVGFEKRISLHRLGVTTEEEGYPYCLVRQATEALSTPSLEAASSLAISTCDPENELQRAAMVPQTAVVAYLKTSPTELWEGATSGTYNLGIARRLTARSLATSVPVGGHTIIFSLEPLIDSHEFAFEEAQVEMITAFRNILVEAAETKGVQRVALAPLCLSTSGLRHRRSIIKLNQSAIIKSFHRLAADDKEELLFNRKDFGVDLYVPDDYYNEFLSTFSEDAWATPESVLTPGRLDLYPGLAPPKGMAELDGWVGKRPELLEAIDSQGKSLLEGTKYALDGSPIEKLDASTYGSSHLPSMRERIEREHATAKLQGYTPKEPAVLGTGLEGDAYQPVVKPDAAQAAKSTPE